MSAAIRSASGRIWPLASDTARLTTALMQQLGLPELCARLLAARGMTPEAAAAFLDPRLKQLMPDPLHLLDMDKAVGRLIHAIQNRERVAVFGDYDVDGATSSALLLKYFADLGLPLILYVPDRIAEGYGPNTPAMQALRAQGVSLVITVDCGITAFAPLQAAKEIGLDVIVLDHHAGEASLPPAIAVVNPNRMDETSDYGYLAAVGVTFLTLVALNSALRVARFFNVDNPPPDLMSYLDIVALGTVCDVVPLVGLNRAFVSQGLKVMAGRKNLGLRTLQDIAGVNSLPNAYHCGFVLGPRINAGGRVGRADMGARLLSTDDPILALQLSQELDRFNTERKDIEAAVLNAAMQQAEQQQDQAVIVASGQGWHPGVIGIVAGRLKERYQRPACVIAIDDQGIGKGSGRSVTGLHLGNLIIAARQQELLLHGGGHGMAAGFSVHIDQLQAFTGWLNQQVAAQIAAGGIVPSLRVDAEISLRGITLELAQILERLAPFGAGNPQPRLMLSNVVLRYAQVVAEKHLRCTFADPMGGKTLTSMLFRAFDGDLGSFMLANIGNRLDVVGTVKQDSWQGVERVQFMIEDVRPASTQDVRASTMDSLLDIV